MSLCLHCLALSESDKGDESSEKKNKSYKRLLFISQEFEDYRDADDAVYELNGKELLGER